MYKSFDKLSKTARIILLIPIWGWFVAGIYRISKYLQGNKNTATLIFGILFIIPVIGFVGSLIDIFTTIGDNKITFLAD